MVNLCLEGDRRRLEREVGRELKEELEVAALVGRCWVCLYDAVPLEDVVFARLYSEAIDGVLLDLCELLLYASNSALAKAGEVYERRSHRRVVIVVCARLMSASRLLGNHIGRGPSFVASFGNCRALTFAKPLFAKMSRSPRLLYGHRVLSMSCFPCTSFALARLVDCFLVSSTSHSGQRITPIAAS